MKNSLPENFLSFSLGWLPSHALECYIQAMERMQPPVAVRYNPAKSACMGAKEPDFVLKGPVEWARCGFYLEERPLFVADPLFHGGLYYVQDASSMFLEEAFGAIEKKLGAVSLGGMKLRVLDLCASPGGKSTHLLSLLGKDSLLVANETIGGRTSVLADNIARWGADNVVVTNNDAADFKRLGQFFDIVLVDAPCSGEGMFRKSIEALSNWSVENARLCAERQKRILGDIWEALAPGGFLIYSTCTYNELENDGNLRWLLSMGAELVPVDRPERLHRMGVLSTPGGGMQFLPGLVEGEGQYFAVVRKTGDSASSSAEGRRCRKGVQEERSASASCKAYREDFPEYELLLYDTFLKGCRKSIASEMLLVASRMKTVTSGLLVAQIKGKDFIPHADLALSIFMAEKLQRGGSVLSGKYFKTVDIDRKTALKFLSREPFLLENAPSGHLMLLYKGCAIGFVKNLGNRVNNLHPVARRIRNTALV